jgi:DNA invertase Pin-like site-specific DNA recombinase
VLVVWKLDRLSRSQRDVLTIMERLAEAKAGFRSLTEAIDTTTPAGRMMMQMVGSFAEFERAMLRERTNIGLDTARREGRIGGRPPKLTPQQQADCTDDLQREKDGCRRGSLVRRAPSHDLTSAIHGTCRRQPQTRRCDCRSNSGGRSKPRIRPNSTYLTAN